MKYAFILGGRAVSKWHIYTMKVGLVEVIQLHS